MTNPMSASDEPLPSNDEVDAFFAGLPPKRARKLSFSEQCGLAYALANNLSNGVVIKAFGLSPATVSHLAQCLKANGRHYRDVRAEYESLGAALFKEKHYAPLHWRLTRTKLDLNHLPGGEDDIARAAGPDPRATKYSFAEHGVVAAGEWFFRVDWLDLPQENGWYFRPCNEDGSRPDVWPPGESPIDQNQWVTKYSYGREFPSGGRAPFRTSSLAYDGAFAAAGLDSPRVKPGRKPK